MKKINKEQLKQLIIDGITTQELKEFDYSHITNMIFMFEGCKSLTSIPHLNTSNVISMSYMFEGCKSLVSIPELDTSNVLDMSGMFYDCHSLNSIPHLDTSNVTDIAHIFYGCLNLEHCFYDHRINYNKINSPKLKQNYPEYFI